MNTTLAIVAYRNPIEEWLWESGVAYWLILGFASLVATALLYTGVNSLYRRWRNRK